MCVMVGNVRVVELLTCTILLLGECLKNWGLCLKVMNVERARAECYLIGKYELVRIE